jgi:Caspase domain
MKLRPKSDPSQSETYAVLVGFQKYDHFSDLPAIANNISAMRKLLTDPQNFGMPEANVIIVDSQKSTVLDVVRAIDTAARAATHTLIVYFVGHGTIDDRHPALHLVLPHTDPTAVDASAVRYDWVRSRVSEGPSRRIVILDCCMSGRALSDVQSNNILDTTDIAGSVVLAACGENDLARAPTKARYTAFTGALISVLHNGLPDLGEYLLISDVFGSMQRSLMANGLPEPQMSLRNRAGDMPFGRNRAWSPTSPRVAKVLITPHVKSEVSVKFTLGKQREMTPEELDEFFEKARRGELETSPITFTSRQGAVRDIKYSVSGADEIETTIAPTTYSTKTTTSFTEEADTGDSG